MTQYHGGKHRKGKKIAEVLNSELSTSEYIGYCEPFHGMLGVYRHIVYKPDLTYLAGDLNKSVMLMWKEAQNGWVPPSDIVSKEEFLRLKFNGESTAEKGFIGCTHAFGALYFKSYSVRKTFSNTAKKVSNIALNSVVSKVKFSYGSYTQFSDLENFLIYCDPPYENTYGYRNDESKGNFEPDKFNSSEFWDWVKKMSRRNTVFVSEFSPPPEHINYETVSDYNYSDSNNRSKKDLLFRILN
jgi:DNA adenine methylase